MLETRRESSSKDEPAATLADTPTRRVFPVIFKSDRTPRDQSPAQSALSRRFLLRRDGKKTLRVKRWLVEQRQLTGEGLSTRKDKFKAVDEYVGTPANAYLAYPHLGRRSLPVDTAEDACAHDYVIVEEDDVRESTPEPTSSESTQAQTAQEVPPTPSALKAKAHASTLTSRIPRPQSVPPGVSWKNLPFAVSLSRRRSSAPVEAADIPAIPSLKLKKSLRRSPLPQPFSLDPDAVTEQIKCGQSEKEEESKCPSPESLGTERTVRLKSKRTLRDLRDLRFLPSSSKSTSSPRHSVASTDVSDPSITAVEQPTDTNLPPSRLNTARSRFSAGFSRRSHEPSDHSVEGSSNLTSPSKHSLVSAATVASRSSFFSSTYTFSSPSQQSVATTSMLGFSANKIPSRSGKSNNIFREKAVNISTSMLSTSSRSAVFGSGARRKTLVVSGIERNNFAALEGLRVWCESFGELRQITRVPNGDLHVDFKRADVADTVCRISAQVYIEGVGSVGVSWYTDKRHW